MEEEAQRTPAADELCPCGSGSAYGECCGRAESVSAADDTELGAPE